LDRGAVKGPRDKSHIFGGGFFIKFMKGKIHQLETDLRRINKYLSLQERIEEMT